MANHTLPTTTDTYANVLAFLHSRIDETGQWYISSNTYTNPPTGVSRWNSTTFTWEKNTGTPAAPVWTAWSTRYDININGTVGATTANTGAFTTLSTSGVASLAASSTVGGSAIVTVGGTQTFTGQNTFNNATAPIIAAKIGPSNTQQHTLPVITSDTIALLAASQTLTNKTYSSGVKSGTFSGSHILSGQVTFNEATAPIIVAKVGPSNTQQHTLPVIASDTIALLAAAQTFTNKTLTTPILRTPQIDNPALTFSYNFVSSAIVADRSITLPLLAADDTFVFQAFAQTLTNKTMSTGSVWNGGTIAVGYGGTGTLTAPTAWGVTYAASASAYATTAAGTANYLLQGNGAAAPTWAPFVLSTHAADAPYKDSVRLATTTDLAASTFAADVLTGYSNVVTGLPLTTTAASTTITATTVAGLKVGAIVSTATVQVAAGTTIATIATGTTFTVTNRAAITTTAITGSGTVATATFAAQTYIPYAVGSTIVVSGTTPVSYSGSFVVTGCTTTTVTWSSVETVTATVQGAINFTIAAGTSIATNFAQTIAALTIDGVATVLNDRVLVKDSASLGGITAIDAAKYNGLYTVTAIGSTTVPWTLTRAVDANTAIKIDSTLVPVSLGTVNAGKSFKTLFNSGNTLNTTPMYFNRIADAAASYLQPIATTASGVDLNMEPKTLKFVTGAVTDLVGTSFGVTTVQAVAASTYTRASTVYIAGAPVASTNATITTPYALYVAGGNVLFGGTASILGNTTLGDASTDTVQVNGYMGVGGAGSSGAGVNVVSAALTGLTQYGIAATPVGTGTTQINGIAAAAGTSNTAFTVVNATGFRAINLTKGAASTITNYHGMYVEDLTQGTNNYGITSIVSSGANKWNIYASGTANNAFAGSVRIGSVVAPTVALDVTGVGTFSAGIQSTPIGSTTASTGAFTTLSASGTVTLGGLVVNRTSNSSYTSFTGGITANTDGATLSLTGSAYGAPNTAYLDATTTSFRNLAGASTFGTFSSTGLAVTGALTATTSGTFGTYATIGGAAGDVFYADVNNTAVKAKSAGGGIYFQTSAGSTQAVIDSAGNLGLGVTPSAWGSVYKAIQNGQSAFMSRSTGSDCYILSNNYYDGTNYRYVNTAQAASYVQNVGTHAWYTAPSGTAGNAITFTQAMTLDASGNLLVRQTSPGNSNSRGFYSDGAGYYGQNHLSGDTSGSAYAYFGYNGSTVGTITQNGTTGIALNSVANLNLTGTTVTAPTVAVTDSSTSVATTAYAKSLGLTAGSTNIGMIRYAGTTATTGQFDGGTTTPTGTTRLNYGGYLYPRGINLDGEATTASAATYYYVGTSGFKYVQPKTLANVQTEIVTTATVAAAGGFGMGTSAKTAAYTVLAADRGDILLCTNTWTLTLTAASVLAAGFTVSVINQGVGTITIDPNSTELVDGLATKALAPGQSCILVCDGAAWRTLGLSGGGATGGGADQIFYENGQTVNVNYTIAGTTNAMSAGPILINTGITVTITSGGVWVIV